MVEWSITTDCKSVAFGLRRFKSYPAHNIKKSKLLLGFFNICLVGARELLLLRVGFERRSYISSAEKNKRVGDQTKLFDEKVLVEVETCTHGLTASAKKEKTQ